MNLNFIFQKVSARKQTNTLKGYQGVIFKAKIFEIFKVFKAFLSIEIIIIVIIDQ